MQLFYAPDISGEHYQLSEPESKHAIRVLRLQEGDATSLMDGCGTFYHCKVEAAHAKRCMLRVEEKEFHPARPFSLHLAIAPTKNMARLEWLVEKATEIGIESITPLICQRSERQVIKTERLEKVVLAAAKQSKAAWLPKVHAAVAYNKFITQPLEGQRFVAHCISDQDRTELSSAYNPGQNVVVLVGPEGDFSPAEVDAALARKFTPVVMGEKRLRTETAGLVACHTIALLNAL